MPSIGIVTALDIETSQLIESFSAPTETIDSPVGEVWRVLTDSTEIVIAKGGVGKVCSSMTTQWLIDRFHPSALLNSGIAGSLLDDITPGTVVLGSRFIQHDFMPASWLNRPQGEIPFMGDRSYPRSSRMISQAIEHSAIKYNLATIHGTIISGDEPVFDLSRREQLKEQFQEFNPIAVDMESAAVAFVASENHIPFAVIRVIADNAKHGDKPLHPGENIKNSSKSMAALSLLIKDAAGTISTSLLENKVH